MRESAFSKAHPLVLIIFVLGMLIVTMSTLDFVLLFISLVMGLVDVASIAKEKHFMIRLVCYAIPILIFMVGIQPLFYHTGSTVIFYVNQAAVYKENYIYGLAVTLMLIDAVVWCIVMRQLLDSEKTFYLFGKLSPTLGLFFTMILRFIPLLKRRLKQIHEGQIAMGLVKESGPVSYIRQRIKEISILIGWSLEGAIETADSMESRGYGLSERTSYNRYNLKAEDICMMGFELIGLVIISSMIFSKKIYSYYLPSVFLNKWDTKEILAVIIYVIVGLMPAITQLIYYFRQRRQD